MAEAHVAPICSVKGLSFKRPGKRKAVQARGQCRGSAVDSPWMQDELEQALAGSWFALPLGWAGENQRPVGKAPATGQGRSGAVSLPGPLCRVSAPDLEGVSRMRRKFI